MNQLQVHPHPAAAGRRLTSAISLLLLGLVVVVVLFVSIRSPLKDDVAWLLYVARRWMAGRELYVDVIEVNPPLIVWISAIPIGLSGWLSIDTQYVAMPLFLVTVLACVWWSATLLKASGGFLADRLPVFALIGAVFLIVPAVDLGQREHLLAAAFLPYLVIFAQRLEGYRRPVGSLIAAGVLAGLGCALKPRYGAVFAVLECLALSRGLRPWRLMPVAAGLTLLGYACLAAISCPAYLRRAVPLALALYGATDAPFLSLLSDSVLLISGQVVANFLLRLRRHDMAEYSLMLTLVSFAATSTAICFVDGKNWYYHQLPATMITILGLALWCASEFSRQRRLVRLPFVIATAAVLVFCFSSFRRFESGIEQAVEPQHTTQARLEQIIRTEHARTYVALSEWIALGFPVVNETGVAWASRFDSMWALKGEVWRAQFDPSVAKEWPIARWVAHDFIAGCPDIAVVDVRGTTNYIKILTSADPAFARVWSRYRLIEAFDGLTVYRRGKSGCLDVWVAAEAKSEPDLR
jgi:hypothetical protein